MADSATIIRDGDESHRLQITHRDWMLLSGPGFAEGPAFIKAFGVFENYSMARGIPRGSLVNRTGTVLHAGASALLAGITRDLELLRFDYSYQVGDQPKRYGGGESIKLGERMGIIDVQPKGYCTIGLMDRRGTSEVIDLRPMKVFATEAGPVKVFRRKAETKWPDILPPVMTFLKSRLDRELTLEHIDRVV